MVIDKNRINIKVNSKFPLVFFLLLLFGCGVDNDDKYLNLAFEIPVEMNPSAENFRIGDTLNINIRFHKEMIEMNGKYIYSFENFDFAGMIRFNRLVDPLVHKADQPGALTSINIDNLVGGVVPFSDAGAELKFQLIDDFYVLSSNFILNTDGVYSITFFSNSDKYSGFERKLQIEGKIASVSNFHYKVNSGLLSNNHLLYEYSASKIDENAEENKLFRPNFSFRVKR